MKEIRILHLLPKMLSLYGEYGNVAIFEKVLKDQGYPVTVTHWNGGELEPQAYDFIYIGSGTEDNLAAATTLLMPYQETIGASIEGGTHWLATGNAMAIFGQENLKVLPYSTHIDANRFMGDVLTEDAFGAPIVGYVNTSCVYSNMKQPLFAIRYGKELGNEKSGDSAEGILYQNFYGTQLIGPVLVKNPHFLGHLFHVVTGSELVLEEQSNIRKAYQVTLQELRKRAGL